MKTLLRNKVKKLLLLFIALLILSGITASFTTLGLTWLVDLTGEEGKPGKWLAALLLELTTLEENRPYLFYGYDWLAFGHIIISLFFIGPLKNPVKNQWVVEYGMVACLLVFPVAFIAGYIRNIPFYWQLVDCSFGLFGFLLLYVIHKKINQLKNHA